SSGLSQTGDRNNLIAQSIAMADGTASPRAAVPVFLLRLAVHGRQPVRSVRARGRLAPQQGQARWLPRYIKRYLVSGALLFAIGWLIEHASPLASAFFYVP